MPCKLSLTPPRKYCTHDPKSEQLLIQASRHWRDRVWLLDCDAPCCFCLAYFASHACVIAPTSVCVVISCLRVSASTGKVQVQKLVRVLEIVLLCA